MGGKVGRGCKGEEQRSGSERRWSLDSGFMSFCSSSYGDSFLTRAMVLWLYFPLFKFFSHQTLRTMLSHRTSSIQWFGWNPSYFEASLHSIMAFSPTSGLNPDKSLLNDIRHYVKTIFYSQEVTLSTLKFSPR